MAPPAALLPGPVFQVAVVVRDLDAAVARYSALLGSDPWRIWTFSAAIHEECSYRGKPTAFSARLALNSTEPQLELIQPLEGPSVHEDWLREHGEGTHHLGVVVASLADTVAAMAAAGFPVVQSGSGFGADGDGAYAYFDTSRDLGLMLEAVEPPRSMPEPELVWTR